MAIKTDIINMAIPQPKINKRDNDIYAITLREQDRRVYSRQRQGGGIKDTCMGLSHQARLHKSAFVSTNTFHTFPNQSSQSHMWDKGASF